MYFSYALRLATPMSLEFRELQRLLQNCLGYQLARASSSNDLRGCCSRNICLNFLSFNYEYLTTEFKIIHTSLPSPVDILYEEFNNFGL